MAKSARNIKMGGKPHKNQDEHASTPGGTFGSMNIDSKASRRVKVAKGLMIKK